LFLGYQEMLREAAFMFAKLGVKTGFEGFVVTWLDQLLGQCASLLKMAATDISTINES
jgi:hypothetical protein